ncbi:MAG: excisionase family DNA-binding protein [Pirellulales bacterium]
MAQKFVSLDEAAAQLGISKDRLNELRENGKVRAYRDGASWKFRADDVEKLVAEGIPAAGSDVALNLDEEPAQAAAGELSDIQLGSDIDLDLGEDEPLSSPAASDVNLDDLDEPTVPVDGTSEGEVLELTGSEDVDEFSDSILLSETEIGESTDRPPSTIIGKAEMAADLDLEIAASDSDASAKSDVRLADPSKSNVFSPGARDAVLDTEPPSLSDNFGDLDELEIDLEAESSRILSPEDLTKAQQAAKSKSDQAKAAEFSDLELATSDSSPGGVLDSHAGGSNVGLSGLSALELEGDDGDVLGDGSDITLSSESSGINIISPSDSGLALDEVPLAMGSSSPIASGLDLGPTSDDVALEPLEVAEDEGGAEPFALTPFGEEASEEEEDSSQIIPLDEVSEDEALLGGTQRSAAVDALSDDFAAIPAGVMSASEPVVDVPFSTANIAGLSLCLLLLVMCGMMVFDLLRNMWSWGEVYTLNSSLMDVLTPILG